VVAFLAAARRGKGLSKIPARKQARDEAIARDGKGTLASRQGRAGPTSIPAKLLPAKQPIPSKEGKGTRQLFLAKKR
jgi:hypothetical protein